MPPEPILRLDSSVKVEPIIPVGKKGKERVVSNSCVGCSGGVIPMMEPSSASHGNFSQERSFRVPELRSPGTPPLASIRAVQFEDAMTSNAEKFNYLLDCLNGLQRSLCELQGNQTVLGSKLELCVNMTENNMSAGSQLDSRFGFFQKKNLMSCAVVCEV